MAKYVCKNDKTRKRVPISAKEIADFQRWVRSLEYLIISSEYSESSIKEIKLSKVMHWKTSLLRKKCNIRLYKTNHGGAIARVLNVLPIHGYTPRPSLERSNSTIQQNVHSHRDLFLRLHDPLIFQRLCITASRSRSQGFAIDCQEVS